ncbi:hypothetical protein HN014_22435 (plasmid) [Aquimarina sp. TRL1]|uniref:hypothetical protein n=1 Tax=Aquimarina sp. (strain TRL1) TaxID=2736252 RepID=UPI00158896EF|nr:hypothetical protein [Aquimarina sp. TRL1]QKX07760.1 hypothetical protein HN014_22435 [Aquimarina sp. TRL1]
MERGIAMQFLLTTAITGCVMLLVFGPSTLCMLICVGLSVLYFSYFKGRDVINQKVNIKKGKINKKKPDVIKTEAMIILKKDGSFFVKG